MPPTPRRSRRNDPSEDPPWAADIQPAAAPDRSRAAAFKFDWQRDLFRARLGFATTAVGTILSTYANSDGSSIKPSFQRLAKGINMDRGTFTTHVQKLVDLGVLAIVAEAEGRPTEYRLVDFYEADAPLWYVKGNKLVPDPESGCGTGTEAAGMAGEGCRSAGAGAGHAIGDAVGNHTTNQIPSIDYASSPTKKQPGDDEKALLDALADFAPPFEDEDDYEREQREARVRALLAKGSPFDASRGRA